MKYFIVTGLLLSSFASYAQNSGTGPGNTISRNSLQLRSSSGLKAEQSKVLAELQVEMVSKLDEIEGELLNGNSAKALRIAKGVLDNVRIKTGIDPKSKIEESFRVSMKFGKNVTSFLDLSEDQKRVVIETISDYHGGLYLDIMNLSKRTSLSYLRAFQDVLEKKGGLTQADKDKILKDLVKASIIPMTVEDKSKKSIVIFDEDVANEDHTYLFNRELKMFVVENKALDVKEEDFDNAVIIMKKELDSKRKGPAIKSNEIAGAAGACMEIAHSVYYSDDRTKAQVSCFNKFYNGFPNYKDCTVYASKIYYSDDRTKAQKQCVDLFISKN